MKDMVPKGTGNSRFLRSSIAEDITHEELVTLLRSGKFPVDFAGLNSAGIQVQGSAYNKGNVLPDVVCAALELPTSAEPKDAFLHISPEYALKVGDVIGSERSLPSSFLPADGKGISKEKYPYLYSLIGDKYGISRVITRRANIPDTSGYGSGQYSSGRINCNEDGLYVLTFSFISSASNREMFAVGVLNESKNKVLYQSSRVSDVKYCDSVTSAFDENYLYIAEWHNDTNRDYIYIKVFNSNGLVKSSSAIFVDNYPMLCVFDGYLHVAHGNAISKLNFETMTLQSVSALPDASLYGFGKVGEYYFSGNYKGKTFKGMEEYQISGDDAESKRYVVRQIDNYILVLNQVSGKVYKTLDGVNFSLVSTGNLFTSGHSCIASDGLHHFISNENVERFYKKLPTTTYPSYVTSNMSYKNLAIRYPHGTIYFPYASVIETKDGYLVPYLQSEESQGIGVQLVPKDYLFNLPAYRCGEKFLKIKVAKTGV